MDTIIELTQPAACGHEDWSSSSFGSHINSIPTGGADYAHHILITDVLKAKGPPAITAVTMVTLHVSRSEYPRDKPFLMTMV